MTLGQSKYGEHILNLKRFPELDSAKIKSQHFMYKREHGNVYLKTLHTFSSNVD